MNMHTAVDAKWQSGRQVGRPPKEDWFAKKEEIERLIEQGWGLNRLAKRYGLTDTGVKLVLKRLGLRTLGMKEEARQ